MIGLPAAGKSTFARRHFASYDYISKDAFPRSVRDKQSRQNALLRTSLGGGRSVVVDNTNVTTADRAAIITIAREFGARVLGIYIEATTKDAVARNEERRDGARVPKVAIFTCAKRLVAPEMSEGFDELRGLRIQADGSVR